MDRDAAPMTSPPTPTPPETAGLTCIPEWCAQEGEHDETCPEHPMTLTKSAFVAVAEGIAREAVQHYLTLRDQEGMGHDLALSVAVDEERTAAVCFAGIGSCGRGWCKHG